MGVWGHDVRQELNLGAKLHNQAPSFHLPDLLHWFVEFIYFCRWEGSIPMHTLSAHRSRNDSRFPLQLWLKSPREGLWLVPLGLCVYPWTNHFTWKVGPFWLARANLISNNFNNFKKLAYFLSDSSGLLVFITYIYAC